MQKVIHRAPIQPGVATTKISLPQDAEILRVAWSRRWQCPCIWYITSQNCALVGNRQFDAVRTGGTFLGDNLSRKVKYVGSYESPAEEVYHVFEVTYQ